MLNSGHRRAEFKFIFTQSIAKHEDTMDEEHDYVTVDKDKVTRCAWCGTSGSKTWIRSQKSSSFDRYCSAKCELADYADNSRSIAIWFPPCGILSFVIAIFIFSFTAEGAALFIIAGSLFLLESLRSIRNYREGKDYRTEVPRESRTDDESLDLVVLKKAKISASCPKCGANLELAQIGPDRIFECRYCGAEGILEWPQEDASEEQ